VDAEQDFQHSEVTGINQSEKFRFGVGDDGFRADISYIVKLSNGKDEDLGSLEAVFGCYYRSEIQITDEVFQALWGTLRFQTWAYFRELMSNVSMRANWPRITVPLLFHQFKVEGAEVVDGGDTASLPAAASSDDPP